MKKMKQLGAVFVSFLLVALLAGCGESTPPPAATPLPTATAVPATAVPTSAPTATPVPFPGLAEWDLLMISDGTNIGVASNYAKLIEADRHVKVNVRSCWTPAQSILTALQNLQNNTPSCVPDKTWADLVREAEVIVVFGNPQTSLPPDGSWSGPNAWLGCVNGGVSAKGLDPAAAAAYNAEVVKTCAPETFAQYKTHFGAVFDKIFELRAGNPVIMRTTDFYIPGFAPMQELGVEGCCTTCVENFSSAVHQVAAEHNVPVASGMTALNG
ncbi:MAG TPA: hypothetical protein VH186_22550, partial [Chloroflexia bacterium]|nr:hypothetical protein [Chloroflexia bacterium]